MRVFGFPSLQDLIPSLPELLAAARAAAASGDRIEAPAAGAPRAPRPRSLEEAAALARQWAHDPAASAAYARSARHWSADPAMTGTLAGASKAERFVGDLLWSAGAAVPTYDTVGWDGAAGRHHAYAERWPARTDLFDRVSDLSDLRPGDVLVVDWHDRTG